MAIQSSDIQFRLSGGASNSNPNASVGGVMSSTSWAGGTLHDLFDVISGDENAASESEYRCVYVRNGHGTLTWEAVKAWLTAAVAGGADLSIGLDPAGAGNGSTTGVAGSVANEDSAPSGVTFSAPGTKAAGLLLGNINAGQAFAIWFKRTAANSAPLDDDGATLNVEGDTAA
jgi:hypothetical protein